MKNNIEIIMLGDSITARGEWKELLEIDSIVNLGVDGESTKDILNRLNIVLEVRPKYVFIMAGINDLNCSIKIEDVFKNYRLIIDSIKDVGITPIIQATLYTTMPALNKKVKLLNLMLFAYSDANSLEYIDLNPSFIDEDGLLRADLTTDGLHLGQKAYSAWGYKLKNLKYIFQ